MSFFKELKEDLAQAVDELLPEEGTAAEAKNQDELQMVNTFDEPENEEEFDLPAEGNNDTVDKDILHQLYEEESYQEDLPAAESEQKTAELYQAAPETNTEAKAELPKLTGEAKRDVTVITKGTVINGSIISDGSLEVMGKIMGDVECLGKLSIIGEVKGNTSASEVYVSTKRLDGNIISEGSVKIAVGTVVVGDINATSSVIAGAVKGQIDVNGPVIVDSTAVIKGNINAKAVQINNGAVLEGFCSLSYSTVDIDTFFDSENEA